jgi:hypothetical protein
MMKYQDGLCFFGLETDHPSFDVTGFIDEDINALRGKLNAYAKSVIEDTLSENWDKATHLEIRHGIRSSVTGTYFQLSINLRPVELLREENAQGNIQVATIRDEHRQSDQVIRSHKDDFSSLKPKQGSLQDPDVKSWLSNPASRDEERGLGRIVTVGTGTEEADLIKTLEAFSSNLSDRLSPQKTSDLGIPELEELIGLMTSAVQDARMS